MKLLRKILIRSGIWGYFYPPYDFIGVKVHRDWPWKKKPLTVAEIISVQYCSWSCEWGADAEPYYEWEDLVKEVKGTWVRENERMIATSTPPQTTSPSYKIFKENEE
tara:strand:+ start:741 stop:1061 length:321 start_codon:yes stop_codon:yes gene_type:complete